MPFIITLIIEEDRYEDQNQIQKEEILKFNELSEIKARRLDSAPVFSTPLIPVTLTYWKWESYLLPSVVDYGSDNYNITATLYNGTELPSWIYFDSRKITFLLAKGVNPSKLPFELY